MGIGYGIGIYDFALVRASLKNLGIAVLLSLFTSWLYFSLSPLAQAQSELLARTTPTIWDVMIALFGGLAGIVAATRKEKSNVIPGVAIATALMPPLCTAGYGLANGNWAFFGGAFYLFTINSVFIAFASTVVVRVFHVREKQFVDDKVERRVRKYIFLIVVLTVMPSTYLAYKLVQNELFKSNAKIFVDKEIASKETYVTQMQIDPGSKTLELTVIGNYIPDARLAAIAEHLPNAGLLGAHLIVHQQRDQQPVNFGALKSGLLSELYTKSQKLIESKDQQIQSLQKTLSASHDEQARMNSIPDEVHALFPQISKMWISDAMNWVLDSGIQNQHVIVLNIETDRPLSSKERARIENWLKIRMNDGETKLVVETRLKRPMQHPNRQH